jgi:hypothetical protein
MLEFYYRTRPAGSAGAGEGRSAWTKDQGHVPESNACGSASARFASCRTGPATLIEGDGFAERSSLGRGELALPSAR